MQKHLLCISAAFLCLCAALPACAAPGAAPAALAQQEAERILQDTFTIAGYVGLKGEADYAGKPQNIIAAALFGAFDAKMEYAFEQDRRKEQGEKPLPASAPLFTVNGRALSPDQVRSRDNAPALFKGLPEQYTTLVSREAVELAALRYTGHAVARHVAPATGFFGDTILNDKGYFVCIDGLGDLPEEPRLAQVTPRGDGFTLSGEILQIMGDGEDGGSARFRLELTPGDAPGTWKRQYTTTPGK